MRILGTLISIHLHSDPPVKEGINGEGNPLCCCSLTFCFAIICHCATLLYYAQIN